MMGDLDWFGTIFGAVPEGDVSWNKRVALAMIRSGLAPVLIRPNDKRATCILKTADAKKADIAAQDAAREAGNPRWDKVKHECGHKHALTEEKHLNRKAVKELLEAGANLAVSFEHSTRRVMVVDVDTDAERRAFLDDWAQAVKDTAPPEHVPGHDIPLTVTSPGVYAGETWKHKDGGHMWFDVADDVELPDTKGKAKWCSCHKFAQPKGGCEKSWALFWGAGYVLVPPSVRPEGAYRVTGEVLPAPAWLIQIAQDSVNYTATAAGTGELNANDGDPVNTWSANTPWATLLTADGWTEWGTDSCGCTTWTLPGGASNPKSATAHEVGCGRVGDDGGHAPLHIWSDALRPGGKDTLTKLSYVAYMRHNGDHRAAMDALGIERRRDEATDLGDVFVLGKASAPESAGAPPETKEEDKPDLAAFWNAREVLRNIRDYAVAEYVSPWAMLGSVLAYVTALTPPRVTVKAITAGSLNLFVGLVGKPGSGKDVAREAARSWFGEVADDAHLYQREIGTGQGLVAAYVRRYQDKETKESVIQQVRESVLVTVSEIDQITAHAKQQASTLVPTLRSAWMGQLLGGLYKDTAKDLSVGAHAYRLCLVVGIQPDHARNLIGDAGGGLPQRFLWMPATDPTLPDLDDDEDPEYPEPWGWKPPVQGRALDDPFTLGEDHHPLPDIVMDVPTSVIREFRRERRARARGTWDGDDLSTHDTFGRLKVAAALALLDQRTEITEADWELADTVMRVSRSVRGSVLRRLEDEDRRQREAEQRVKAEEAVAVEKAKSAEALATAKTKISNVLGRYEAGEWVRSSLVRRSITAAARPYFEEAVTELVSTGLVEREESERGHVLRLKQ